MSNRSSLLGIGISLAVLCVSAGAQSIYETSPALPLRAEVPAFQETHQPTTSTPPKILPLEIRQRHQSNSLSDSMMDKVSFQDDGSGNSLLLRRPGIDADKSPRRNPLVTVLSALSIVLGLYLGFVWLARRGQNTGGNDEELPAQVANVLGSFSLSPQQDVHVIRFGSKLLAVVLTPEGCQPIGEIDDPEEVEYLTKVCHFGPSARMPARLADLIEEPEYATHNTGYRRR